MLRPLEYEVPPEVGKTDDVKAIAGVGVFHGGL
jgi:hypothetical protein